MNYRLYAFHLDFPQGPGSAARFPFIFEDHPVSGIGCLLSPRSAGDMACIEGVPNPRREGFFRSLGKDPALVYGCIQRHSRDVLVVDSRTPNRALIGDGLVSGDRGITLSVTVADCLPVFLYDTAAGAFALVHSGWRGTGIVLEALRLMGERWGSRPSDIAAVLGPCIQDCCYRVDEERARAFETEFGGEGDSVIRRTDEPAYYLNLQAANTRLLVNAGVRHIAACEDCTFTDERLGSFRREGETYTRMAALLGY